MSMRYYVLFMQVLIVFDNEIRYNNCTFHTRETNPSLFELLPDQYRDLVAAMIDPQGDGNCGFRAVSLALFKNQDAWKETKKLMLNNLERHQAVYHTYGVLDIEAFRQKLSSTETPARLENWFDTLECPQTAANTFNRAVVLFATTPKVKTGGQLVQDEQGNTLYNKDMQTYVPCFGIDLNMLFDPIILFLYNSHFYLIDLKVNQKSKKPVEFPTWPDINPYHSVVMRKHSNTCPSDFSEYFK